MDFFQSLWHVLNFFAPALGVGLLATALCKLCWWRGLRSVAWWRLALWACGPGAVALVFGLVLFGRDGKMSSYGLLVLGAALGLWWRGLRKLN
jgi:hypothetical protein